MARPIKGQTFWDRVWIHAETLDNGCIVFNGNRDDCGYGRITKDGKLVRIHREVYKYLNPDEVITGVIMHSCDNPACINWEHLSHGTQAQNVADMVAKGRRVTVKGENQHDAKLKNDDIKAIRYLFRVGVKTQKIAKYYDVSEVTVDYIRRGKTWTHVEGEKANIELLELVNSYGAEKLGLSASDIPVIRRKIANGVACSHIAKEYNVSAKTIRLIRNNQIWKHA